MIRPIVCGVAVMFALGAFAGKSEATMITFDQFIGGVQAPDDPGDPFDACVVACYYGTASPGGPGTLTTQGFTFMALPNTSGSGDQGLGIAVDPSAIGLADNGTDWLLAGGIVQMTRENNDPFSLFSFQAAKIEPSDETLGQFIRVFGDKAGGPFQLLTFDLSAGPGFQTFFLPSDWTDLTRVRFSGRLTPGDLFPRGAAVDNINTSAAEIATVPEPSSLVLLGSGALGLFAKARRRFARKP